MNRGIWDDERIVLVKAIKDSEAGATPSTELLEAMGRYNKERANAGILLAGEGVHPSMKGKRVAFDGSSRRHSRFAVPRSRMSVPTSL